MKHTILFAALGGALIVLTPIFSQSSSQAWAQDQGRLPAPPHWWAWACRRSRLSKLARSRLRPPEG
jgi:hypothetical protein